MSLRLHVSIFSGLNHYRNTFQSRLNLHPAIKTHKQYQAPGWPAPEAVAETLSLDPETIDPITLHITAPFQQRKRGVETKFLLADAPASRDDTLIRNIALAHRWLERIKAGETFGDIATSGNTSKRRVQHMIDLAFLAPDIVRDVLDGKQPLGFTSDWCKARILPSDWQDQRDLLATL